MVEVLRAPQGPVVHEENIHFPEIRKLVDPLTHITREIVQSKRQYGMVLGDDTSGRIPTLIVGKVLNELNKNQGQSSIPVRFVVPNIISPHEQFELMSVLNNLRKPPERVLIVTETIMYGGHVGALYQYLLDRKIRADTAIVSLPGHIANRDSSYDEQSQTHRFVPMRNYYGDIELLRNRQDMTGLSRHTVKDKRVIKRDAKISESVRLARTDVETVSQIILGNL